jgi:hypothetical protein
MNESDILGYNSYAPIVIHPERIEQEFRKAINQGDLEGWEGLDLSSLQLDWDRIAARACENLMSDPYVERYVAEAIEDSLQDEIARAVGREEAQGFPER